MSADFHTMKVGECYWRWLLRRRTSWLESERLSPSWAEPFDILKPSLRALWSLIRRSPDMDWSVVRGGTTWPKEAESPAPLPGAVHCFNAAQALASASRSVMKVNPVRTLVHPLHGWVCSERPHPDNCVLSSSAQVTPAQTPFISPASGGNLNLLKSPVKHPLSRFPFISSSQGVIG